MSKFKITKEIILKAAKWRLSKLPQERQEFREKKISERMAKKRWFGLGRPYTREEAETYVDKLPSDVFDSIYHWQFQYVNAEARAEKLVKMCGISKEILLDDEDAEYVASWYSKMEQEQLKNANS